MSIAAVWLAGCSEERGGNFAPQPPAASDPWQYPLRLGDTRAKVHDQLTAGKHPRADTEEYPASGLTVLFDDDHRVTKLTFAGTANGAHSDTSPDSLLTDRQIVFGLTGHTNESEFKRILGKPAREIQERSGNQKDLHYIWKKDGYVVDAVFLASDSARDGENFPAGSLVRVELYRGL